MSALEMAGLSHGALGPLQLSLDAGVHAVLGAPSDGTQELVAIAAGLVRPRRGSVRVAGSEPYSSPDTRRRIAALLARERLIPAATVGASVARALTLSGRQTHDATAVLAAFGLGSWADRRLDSLGAAEQRSVALAIALSHEKPLLVALYEPLSDVTGVPRQSVLEGLARLGSAGACVLCVTASVRDASDISPTVLLLDRGRLVRRAAEPLAVQLAPGTTFDFIVRSDDPRRLASVLSREQAISGVDWNQQQSPGEIRVRGAQPEQTALSIARAALENSIQIRAISPSLPGLDVIRGANDGLARAAYEQASARAQAQTRAAFRAAPGTGAPGQPLYGPSASPAADSDEPPEGGAV